MSRRGAIPIQRVGSNLLATLPAQVTDATAEGLQQDILERIRQTGATGLVIDISGLEIVDTYVARVIATTGRMAKLMGTDTALVGMRPEVAATLVRMGFRMEGVLMALDVDEGLTLLERAKRLRT